MLVFPIPAMTAVNVGVRISLPPPIVFAAPPEVIVIPGTYVYAVPDLDADMFFYRGWWWRLWEGRWYRSRNYNAGWGYYRNAPSFYRGVPAGWRNDYRAHRWQGQQWNYQRIPQQQVQQNWNNWEKSKHWEKQNTWGVQGLKPRARSQQPSQAVQPRPKAEPRSREAAKPQQSRPQSREVQPQHPQPQHQEAPQQSRPQSGEVQQQHEQQHQESPQQSEPRRGNPERGDEGKQDRR